MICVIGHGHLFTIDSFSIRWIYGLMRIMQLLFATSNKGKIIEIKESLHGLPIELLTVGDLDNDFPEPEETGATFQENAIQKATYYYERTGMPTFADDSGIEARLFSRAFSRTYF